METPAPDLTKVISYTPDECKQHLEFIEVFKKNATDVSRATKAFNVSRKTFYNWYKFDAAFKDAVDDAKEEMKDFGESQLYTLMKGIPKLSEDGTKIIGWVSRPDTAAVIFFNKTKNKDRGYDERTIVRREGGLPDNIIINVSDAEQAKQLNEFLHTDNAEPK